MNCEECTEVKAVYDKCLKEYLSTKALSWDVLISGSNVNKCEEPFQVDNTDYVIDRY